jgi:uncharacterized protein (DUF58 family)
MSFLDSAALMRIRSLELRARVVVEGLWRGLHRSPYHGFSVEFTEYRPYVKGDDPRHVDWKVAARTDRHYIKKYEDETNLRCQFLLDQSRSMLFGSGSVKKCDYAATLVASLSWFLMQQGDAAGLSTFGEHLAEHLPPRNRPGHFRRMLVELEKPPSHAATSLTVSLGAVTDLLRKRGMVILVSDLLAPVEQLETQLALLATRRHDMALFHIMDRAEVEFNFEEAVHFRSMEGGEQLMVDPRLVRANYLEKHGQHLKRIKEVCAQHRIRYHAAITDVPLEKLLLDYLMGSEKRSRGQIRSGSRA